MNFLHLSDTHFLCDYARVRGPFHDVLMRMQPPLTQLDNLLAQLQKRLDFVVFTGDLCEMGRVSDYRALQAALLWRFCGIPIFSVPGNHDSPENYRAVWADSPARVSVKEYSNLAIILLDSTDPAFPNGRITEDDCDRLELLLSQRGSAQKILLTHHHLIDAQFALPTAKYPPRFAEILAKSGVLAIFNGHTHHSHEGLFAGIPCYTSGSLSFRGTNHENSVSFDQYAAVRICTLDENGLRSDVIAQKTSALPLCELALPIA